MSKSETSAKKKIALIVQRYGNMINGGAEVHARNIATRLTSDYNVTILTSRALDYHHWKPELPEGESWENGIKIIRFNHPEKGLNAMEAILYVMLKFCFTPMALLFKKKYKRGRRTPGALEIKFDKLKLKKQGPYMPQLLPYLHQNDAGYEAFIFFTYLYYPTAMGISKVAKKSILIPTIHDEPAVYRGIYQEVMSCPAAIFFNTEAELKFSQRIFNMNESSQKIVASGIDIPKIVPEKSVLQKYGIQSPYLLYVGRVEEGKGCKELVQWHQDFTQKHPSHLGLVMVGKNHLHVHGEAIFTGFISEEEKHQIISQAAAIVVPSKYESLSLALLEGFAHGVPGLVNGNAEVLLDHIQQSGAGWSYTNREEFDKVLKELSQHPESAATMGIKGKTYVQARYDWNNIMSQYKETIEKISSTTNCYYS